MERLLTTATLAIVLAGVAVVAILAMRRLRLGRDERRRTLAEERMRPVALALVDGDDPDVPALHEEDAPALAGLLARYAHLVDGAAHERIADFFVQGGHVDREAALLRDRRPWRRAAAAHALGDMGPAGTVPLIIALGDRNRDVRSAAARSLGRLRSVEAVSPIVRGLSSGSIPTSVGGDALLAIGREAAETLQGLMTHPDPQVRTVVIDLLGLVGADGDAAPVQAHLTDASPEVRSAAARALGHLGAEGAAEALRDALSDPATPVRAAAAAALGAIGDVGASRALLTQARLDVHEAAVPAAQALALLDPDRVTEAAGSRHASGVLHEVADLIALGRTGG